MEKIMNLQEIKETLKQREPFLMIDKVLKYDKDKECVALKVFKGDEPFFKGHFPNNPIVPGVLIVEALAQTASIVVLSIEKNINKNAVLSGIEKIKFKKVLVPNEKIELRAEKKNEIENFYIMKVEAKNNENIIAAGEIMLTVV